MSFELPIRQLLTQLIGRQGAEALPAGIPVGTPVTGIPQIDMMLAGPLLSQLGGAAQRGLMPSSRWGTAGYQQETPYPDLPPSDLSTPPVAPGTAGQTHVMPDGTVMPGPPMTQEAPYPPGFEQTGVRPPVLPTASGSVNPRVDDIASAYQRGGGAGGFNQLRNEEYLGNPRLALLNAMGGAEPYNYMMRRILNEYDQAIPLLATLSGYQSGNPEVDIADFTKQFLGGLTGRGPRQDIGSQITALLGAASGGDQAAIDLLDQIGASGAMSALGLGERQRGVLPAFQRARAARRQREYESGEVRRIERGPVEGQTAATGDTATWARLLAQLAGR